MLFVAPYAAQDLRLNRPPVNALSPELIAALLQAVEAAPQEGKRALVLSGSPGMFSAGLNVPLLLKLDRPAMDALWREFYALLGAISSLPIPIVAAITGHAPAGGTVLALFCAHLIAAEGVEDGPQRGAGRASASAGDPRCLASARRGARPSD